MQKSCIAWFWAIEMVKDIFSVQQLHFIQSEIMKQNWTNVNLFVFTLQFSESPLSSWSTPQAASQSTHHLTSGRSWTVAGTSLANMFPEQVKLKHHDFNFEVNYIAVFRL